MVGPDGGGVVPGGVGVVPEIQYHVREIKHEVCVFGVNVKNMLKY